MEEKLIELAKEFVETMRDGIQAAMLSGRWTKVYTAAATAMLSQGQHLTGTDVNEVIRHAERIADVAEEHGMKVSEATMERMVVITDKVRRVNLPIDKSTN